MKTRCPNCNTSFRVTPDQLKARVGKVRCGQCHSVFNALDSLLEDKALPPHSSLPTAPPAAAPVREEDREKEKPAEKPLALDFDLETIEIQYPTEGPETFSILPVEPREPAAPLVPPVARAADATTPAAREHFDADDTGEELAPLSESEAHELGKSTGLILPRETTKIPGYSKWSDGIVADPLVLPAERAARWPYVIVALVLVLLLGAQALFRFRSEIAVTMPALRPLLSAYAEAFDADIPLPRHVELVSIEASDLQKEARGNLLVLNATLRNRAAYAQGYPLLELSLTDTQDAAIARRVFAPSEYLSSKLAATQSFAANSDVAVRLWIEAKGIDAAGYRLYVFYP
jgi:predicted Zn finger-like uncharacterized protein